MKKILPVIAIVAMMLFGCLGGNNTTPTPEPTPVPQTPTPGVQATPTPVATPEPTPTPEPVLIPTPEPETSWASLFGCAETGLAYTYRVNSNGTEMDIAYATSAGGSVEGVDTVLKTTTMTAGGMQVQTREWDSRAGCRCVKTESVIAGTSYPGQCPSPTQGGGEAPGAETRILPEGFETISVPAFSGVATKYTVISTSASGTYTASVWTAPGIDVPVKMTMGDVTTVLVSYSRAS